MKDKNFLEQYKNIKQHVDLDIDFKTRKIIGITKLYFQNNDSINNSDTNLINGNNGNNGNNTNSQIITINPINTSLITNESLIENFILKLNSENLVIKSVNLVKEQHSLKFSYINPNHTTDYLKSLYNNVDDPESIRNINRVIIT